LEIQAVVFHLGVERFALPVVQVREILDYREAFHMPGTPPWLLGLTDVRGTSVPIIDLRLRLGMTPVDPGDATRILVVELPGAGRDGAVLVLGLMVDRVVDVSDFAASAQEEVPDIGWPDIGGRWHSGSIAAVARREDGFVLLLDLAGVLAGASLDAVDPVATAA
jgi:purine-binding chemotaxis protein CheW